MHIDLTHYATIKEESDGAVLVECLMCGKTSPDLIDHGNHIKQKHPYAEGGFSKKNKQISEVITENSNQKHPSSDSELN